jgi:uncharacterized membrane protein YfcA
MVFAHITNMDAASLLPSAIALIVVGVIIGGMLGPRFVKKATKRKGGGC